MLLKKRESMLNMKRNRRDSDWKQKLKDTVMKLKLMPKD